MKQILILTLAYLLIGKLTFAQAPAFQWGKSTEGTGSSQGNSTVVDAQGNIYTTGIFYGTVDFDPNATTFNLTSAALSGSMFVSKLDENGNFIWAKQIGGGYYSSSTGNGIALDASNNVYLTGEFSDTVDFNPSATVFNLISTSQNGFFSDDVFILKLDASGNFTWAKSIGNIHAETGAGIAVDASSNSYITGKFSDVVDFNPSASTAYLSSGSPYSSDIYILKLDVSGNYVWAKNMGGIDNDEGYAIALDASANVYTTGYFYGSADFNPSASVFNINGNGSNDAFVSKLTSAGAFVWARNLGGFGSDVGYSIAVDNFNQVYTTGTFTDTADFNPGVSTFNLISKGGAFVYNIFNGTYTTIGDKNNMFISKLDASGNFSYAKQFGGVFGCYGNSIAVDNATGNVYTTGTFIDSCDFNPSASSAYLVTSGSTTSALFISILDASGFYSWAGKIEGADGRCIKLNGASYIYTTGSYNGTIDLNPNAGIYNLTSNGGTNCLVHKMSQCMAPTVTASATATTICNGNSIILTGNGASSYTWSNGAFNSIATIPTATTTYTVTGKNAAGCTATATKLITVLPLPTVGATVSANLVCIGNSETLTGTGASTYTWTGGVPNNYPFVPTSTTTYTVTGTDIHGCSNTATRTVVVNPKPTVTATASPNTICLGSSTILNGVGAFSYSWLGGIITNGNPFSPTTTNTYTVTGTDIYGCTNTATKTITVNPLPIVTATSSANNICANTPITLSGSGAATYTWSGGITNSVPFTATATATYTVTGTNSNGCTKTSTLLLTVYPIPNVVANASSTLLCNGDALTLTGSGANTYVWSSGIPNGVTFLPNYTSTYTVTGTSLNGCTNTNSITVNMNPCNINVTLKFFIEGYYTGGGLMNTVLVNENVSGALTYQADSVTIELHQSYAPYAIAYTYNGVVRLNGILLATFPSGAASGNSYYIVIKHRNSINTWSALPVSIVANSIYDFTTAANNAYGNNQVQVETNIFALYTGDLNQDENVDLLDASIQEVDITNFAFGYYASDLNGDGNVDLLDSPILEGNVTGFVFSSHP